MKTVHWKKIGEEVVYEGFRKIVRKEFILPNDKKHFYDVLSGEDAVGVVALTKGGKILIVRQFRPGTERIYDEIPGGIMNHGEKPLAAIKRELLEETGYTGKFKFVCKCVTNAYRDSMINCFVATECYKLKNSAPDHTEFIEVVEKPVRDFIRQARKGLLSDTEVAFLGLDYLGLLK